MSKPSRSDARLYTRALRQGWNIPVKKRTGIVRILFDVVQGKNTTSRERTSAARALMQASRLELEAIRLAQEAQYQDMVRRLDAIEGKGESNGKLARPAGEA